MGLLNRTAGSNEKAIIMNSRRMYSPIHIQVFPKRMSRRRKQQRRIKHGNCECYSCGSWKCDHKEYGHDLACEERGRSDGIQQCRLRDRLSFS